MGYRPGLGIGFQKTRVLFRLQDFRAWPVRIPECARGAQVLDFRVKSRLFSVNGSWKVEFMLTAAIRTIEVLFVIGVAGSALVVILTTIEDFRTLFKKDEP
jgi:hypothetical protein